MKTSVVVCTYNRSKLLESCLNSLASQDFLPDEYEIIVIDNNSTDNTKHVVNQVKKDSPTEIHYIIEKRQGLSYARNTGVKEARGKIVAFIDDDAIADRSWLNEIVSTFEKINPVPGCVGGKVMPIWIADRPKWLPESLLTYLGVLNHGDSPKWTEENEYVWGVNMAFLRSSLEKVGLFDPSLGRKGKSLVSNEEIFLFFKLRESGENIYYQPKAIVHHLVPQERLKRTWFLRRVFAQGISDYRSDMLKSRGGNQIIFVNPLRLIVELLYGVYCFIFSKKEKRHEHLTNIIIKLGYTYGRVYDIIAGSKHVQNTASRTIHND